MPRRSSARRTARTQSIVVRPVMPQAQARPIVIREVKLPKVTKGHRRGRRPGGRSERDRMYPIGAGLLLGFIDKQGTTVPTIPMLGKAGTLALACFAWGKYGHSPLADDLATGFATIAAYEYGKEGTVSGDYVAGGL